MGRTLQFIFGGKYESHINIEVCSSIKTVKYLCARKCTKESIGVSSKPLELLTKLTSIGRASIALLQRRSGRFSASKPTTSATQLYVLWYIFLNSTVFSQHQDCAMLKNKIEYYAHLVIRNKFC